MIKTILKSRDRFFGIMRDIRNYFYIRKIVKKHRDTDNWNKFKLRVDYIYRIYTVINLRAEDFGEADQYVKETRFREKAEPLYEYLTELNLHEIIRPVIEYVPGTYSYLVKFVPRLEWLTFGWFMGFIFKLAFLYGVFYLLGMIFNLEYLWNLLVQFLINNKVLR